MKLVVFALLFLSASSQAADNRDWRVGKVLDSQAAKTYLVSGASANDWAGNGTEIQVHHMAIQNTQLAIVGNEYAYLIDDSVQKAVGLPLQGSLTRALANRKHGCRYVVGDAIQYAQEKKSLYVRDADGKECKLDIVRQERLRAPSAGQPGPDRSTNQIRPVEKPIAEAPQDDAARADAAFAAQLKAEFPEVVEDSARMDQGLKPQSALFLRAAEIYRENIALNPALEGTQGALLVACRQAKRELDAKKAATPQVGSAAPPKVRFTSNPPGVEVSIDGEYFGSTPIEVGQKEGAHIVRLKKRCYAPWERTITLKLGDARAVLAELDREPVDPARPSIAGLCDAP